MTTSRGSPAGPRKQATAAALGSWTLSTSYGRPARAVLSWLWLALAYHKQGKASEARQWLDKAANWLDQQGGQMPLEISLMGAHRHNWLEAHVLRREAEELIQPAEKR